MTQTVHVINGVVDSAPVPIHEGFALADCYHADFVTACTEAPDGVSVGWTTLDGGKTFSPPAAVAPIPIVRAATTYQLMSVLTDAQRAAYPNAKQWDQRLFGARDTPWPEDNPKIARIAIVLSLTPAAWFDAALAPVSA